MIKNRKPHQLELNELQEFLESSPVHLFAICNTKKLEILIATGTFVISSKESNQPWVESKIVWQGTQPYSAVEEYNKIL